jgi:hypothetical protein
VKCLNREILTRERVRKFSSALYKIATEREEKETSGVEAATTTGTHLDATPIHVEKMVKLFKTHWCAMDFDTNFCRAIFIKEADE